MPSFLVTSKMSPALRARVLASVSGRKQTRSSGRRPRTRLLVRSACVAAVLLAVGFFALSRSEANQQIEQARASLSERWRRQGALLTPQQKALNERVSPWLSAAARPYAGDSVASELKQPALFERVLRRPMLYVRGPSENLSNKAGIEASALGSVKDAFVLCLLDPPPERSEKQLLRKVRSLYAGSESSRRATEHVERLGDAVLGLPLLAQGFHDRVQGAEKLSELETLRRTWERAPLEGALRASKAELLLFVIDEPGSSGASTELDGERPHAVRVGLLELSSGRTLLRLRRQVDPSWLSDRTRSEYASSVDSCALAFDVRRAVVDT